MYNIPYSLRLLELGLLRPYFLHTQKDISTNTTTAAPATSDRITIPAYLLNHIIPAFNISLMKAIDKGKPNSYEMIQVSDILAMVSKDSRLSEDPTSLTNKLFSMDNQHRLITKFLRGDPNGDGITIRRMKKKDNRAERNVRKNTNQPKAFRNYELVALFS
jgi:hypothetical protein